jgi:hypothetical protein
MNKNVCRTNHVEVDEMISSNGSKLNRIIIFAVNLFLARVMMPRAGSLPFLSPSASLSLFLSPSAVRLCACLPHRFGSV